MMHLSRIFSLLLALLLLSGSRLSNLQAQAPARVFFSDNDSVAVAPIHRMPTPERVTQQVGVQNIIPRIPVIMVEFSDFSFSRTREEVDSLFNAENYTVVYPHATAVGSMRRYFRDQSFGQYDPQFDIYGPVQVSKSCCDNFHNNSGTTRNVAALVIEACTLADSIIDFSQYDSNQDGKVDLVYIYYAGFGSSDQDYIDTSLVAAPNQLIWPHWSTTSSTSTFDGLSLRDYECANELDGYWTHSLHPDSIRPAGIGIAVHEFCHALGLPDLYPTNHTSSQFKHLGAYDVMDYGCYNNEMFCPASLSAYERWFLGWLTPTLLNEPQNVELSYIGDSNEAFLITLDGQPLSGPHADTASYYLLQNRQKQGWDAGTVWGSDILGHGLMIQRIAYDAYAWQTNTVNNDSTFQRIKLISADGDYSIIRKSWFGKKKDLFPAGATEYLDIEDFPITEIEEDEAGVIRFKFMGGAPETVLEQQDADATPRKRLINGQVVIERAGKRYSVLGNPL